ncbi:hypothetical protein VCRA2123O444_320017 [Vibrio crassostreae]|nr:hypothetical protein VCRA2118O429_250034 [Vibrio crassostreae]CAK1942486.1 hypothetical protein VCRA2113O412_260034 [Vibrio crassostreae]CAK1943206.1 hypothetical protein VCRA2113O413_260032 [Vibrio crassostreae]CAK1943798.1 hypothetical protein VCRA2114O423_260040 [Vibrio crassostreae]CAK1945569.1 hypothetical protein VCRA2113O411_260040 [Vibrio crassostreae]
MVTFILSGYSSATNTIKVGKLQFKKLVIYKITNHKMMKHC